MIYFNVSTIAVQWKYHVLKIIKNGGYLSKKIEKASKNTATKFYKENKKFFFNVGNGDINNIKGIIKYLGRYLARSPIVEYKITDKEITFFNNLANDKKKTYITMPSEKFISHILIHLIPKNFKRVNHYGCYSRRISDRLKRQLILSEKTLPCQNIHFIKGRCTRLSG